MQGIPLAADRGGLKEAVIECHGAFVARSQCPGLVRSLNLRFSDIAVLPALLIFAVLAPANTAVAAVTLQITGRAVGCLVTFWTAMGGTSAATLAGACNLDNLIY
ncbi:hypothetical protein [Pseudogemmobacter sp. W21_MBD1_M6]|uniref:hypothetical protein n=1 Tax=Pseudogemmobacter sp. W21_MBD1_M6 TaxID=3240271 RepID=UPI003F9C0E17